MKKNYLITNLRVLAIILVVLGHSIVIFNPTWNYFTSKYSSLIFQYLGAIIYIFHLPLFFSISGFLFGISNEKHKYSFLSLLKNKSKRLLVPYFFFSLLWLLPIRLLVGYENYSISNNSIFNIIFQNIILGKDNGHLWFLPSLFLIFIIYSILKKIKIISKNGIVFFLFLCLISLIGGHFLPTYIGTAFSYLMWFGFGDFIRENKKHFEKRKVLIIVFGIISIILCIFYLYVYLKSRLLSFLLKNAICFIWISILYCYFPKSSNKLLEKIDKNSFGIYLFHSPLIYITFRYFSDLYPTLIFLINFVFWGGIAYFLTYLTRKAKLGFLIGEGR